MRGLTLVFILLTSLAQATDIYDYPTILNIINGLNEHLDKIVDCKKMKRKKKRNKRALCAKEYKAFGLRHSVDKKVMVNAIQSMVNNTLGKGFKMFSSNDLHHGHLVFEKDHDKPFGILFHTQENAEYTFDLEARNWLTFLKPPYKTINLHKYRYSKQTRPSSQFDDRHTIVHKLIDPDKIGRKIHLEGERGYGVDGQFNFRVIDCKDFKKSLGVENTHFKLTLPGKDKTQMCLTIGSSSCTFEPYALRFCPPCLKN